MPAHSASEDARKRAYGAGIHVFLPQKKTWNGRDKPGHELRISTCGIFGLLLCGYFFTRSIG
jgi:hypothetical protein